MLSFGACVGHSSGFATWGEADDSGGVSEAMVVLVFAAQYDVLRCLLSRSALPAVVLIEVGSHVRAWLRWCSTLSAMMFIVGIVF